MMPSLPNKLRGSLEIAGFLLALGLLLDVAMLIVTVTLDLLIGSSQGSDFTWSCTRWKLGWLVGE